MTFKAIQPVFIILSTYVSSTVIYFCFSASQPREAEVSLTFTFSTVYLRLVCKQHFLLLLQAMKAHKFERNFSWPVFSIIVTGRVLLVSGLAWHRVFFYSRREQIFSLVDLLKTLTSIQLASFSKTNRGGNRRLCQTDRVTNVKKVDSCPRQVI